MFFTSFLHRLTYELSIGSYPDGDKSVYTILHWKAPEGPSSAVKTSFAAMIGGFVAFSALCWGIYRLKSMITGIIKIGPLRIHPPPPEQPQNDEEAHEADEINAESESGVKVRLMRFEAVDDQHSVGRSSFMSAPSAASSVVPDQRLSMEKDLERSSATGPTQNHKKDIIKGKPKDKK